MIFRLLENWPERVKTMQTNWIGRSEGAEVVFDVEDKELKFTCFTTRIDTIFGATFLGLSFDAPGLQELIKGLPNHKELETFIEKIKNQALSAKLVDNFEKEGMFTGCYAINPFSGKKVPIWIANYILAGYGTGAIMCVPAHDERDYDFAKKYKLEIIEVVREVTSHKSQGTSLYEGEGVLVNSDFFDGLTSAEAKKKIDRRVWKKGYR